MQKLLNGKWQFKDVKSSEWLVGTVPGCNYLDLLNLDLISDPFDGLNEKDAYWVAKTDWEYKKSFKISKQDLQSNEIRLTALMLDTICDVFINEKLVGYGQNCHIKYSFPIKDFLVVGENTIRILFRSPVNFVDNLYKKEKTPRNNNGQNGIVNIRKPQCHFGWDWGPVLPPSGITKDIYIEFLDVAQIDDFKITQEHKDGTVLINVNVKPEIFDTSNIECEVSVEAPNGKKLTQKGFSSEFLIKNPELWWTNDLSDKKEQPLYKVTATLYKEGKKVDTDEKKIGLRTIVLNRDNDVYGSNFQFILNGVPLFIKGANYIPPDSFITRFDEEKLQYTINSVLFSNMNMLRIWGGGYYESDELYDACDKYGILLWQDFCFACQAYPFFKEAFLQNVKDEIKYNVTRLRHHASLAIWSGNNEIEAMSIGWATMTQYIEWTEKFFYQILEPEVRKCDNTTAFIPGSPCGISHNNGHDKDNVGDTHLWAVWHGLQPMNYYRKRMTRFCSEFGFESLPDIKTIQKFAKPSDYSLKSEVFTAHQKCNSGNMKMVYYIASRFRLPKHFEDFIYLSQVTQQECISDATEHWRRNKGRCNGAMYWQLNDCWPVCSWAGMDYYGNYKALQYTARYFNAPVSVSIENTDKIIRIVCINDLNKELKLTVRYRIFDFITGIIAGDEIVTDILPIENKEIFVFNVAKLAQKFDIRKTGIIAELLEDDNVISRKTVLFGDEKDLFLPKSELSKEVKICNDHLEISVSTDTFARLVRVESSISSLPFSDNYFDLLPTEIKTITMPLDKNFTAKEQAESLSLFCVSDVEPDGNKRDDKIKKAKILLDPVNLGNWIYNRQIPKDAK
ncbi:MAG: glycoside hydrolase family 2 protein [Oscillospiraceae bacterium]